MIWFCTALAIAAASFSLRKDRADSATAIIAGMPASKFPK